MKQSKVIIKKRVVTMKQTKIHTNFNYLCKKEST
ncbi:hypothetical protein SAMN04487935_2317 [Flavobacterium noncentrifugens]|uniref:Uncharacterized protein n=2 Tax=Flavobacterium noncentrifugens TaxID=1128970 RepID=A0A1G8YH44_9FLAO|nr:hypothetical protein SAMN04487935_2317 [Flavobacterium noncentrifugens]